MWRPALFLRRGFDQVSVSEIAEAADVARPTVFAHFPRKEDLFFDRYPEVAGQLTRAIRERPAGKSAISALRDTIAAAAQSRPGTIRHAGGHDPVVADGRGLTRAAGAGP